MENTYFTILHDLGRVRISGSTAALFIKTMTTVDPARISEVGTAAPALVLTSDAEIIDVVMILRTGDVEYMLTCMPATREEMYSWLQAHALLSDESGPIFEDLVLTDETEHLVTLAVYGPDAYAIVDELAAQGLEAALGSGQVAVVFLGDPHNGIMSLVCTYPLLPLGYLELNVTPEVLEGLEYLLLSFPEIDPEPFEEFYALRRAAHTWFNDADSAAYMRPDTARLQALIRQSRDFVGARAL